MDFTLNMGSLPLIEIDGDHLTVNEEAVRLIEGIESPVCPVAVVGLYRSGKSSLLNFLRGENGFRVGPTVSRCTRGVWVSSFPVNEKSILLLDTEGVGGLQADSRYDARIFALAALLGATLVYNSLGAIDENALSQLSFVAQLSSHIGDEDIDRYMPLFIWVLRDFALELEDERGDPLTPDEYLENALRPQRGYEASILERNRLRHMLTSFFPHRKCHPLVRPLADESRLQQIDDVPYESLRPQFRQGLDDLKEVLFEPPTPKTINGAPLRGRAYADLVRHFVKAINDGGVPVIASAWDHVSTMECQAAENDALELFKKAVPTPSDPVEDLDAKIDKATKQALKFYASRALGDSGSSLEDKIRAEIVELRAANAKVSSAFCSSLAAKLYVELVWTRFTPQTSAENLALWWAEHKREYATRARGPSKHQALVAFLYEKFPETTNELARRIEARRDHEAALEHDRLVKVKAELAEFQGTKEARAHMLSQAQETLIQSQMDKAKAEARAAAASKQLEDARLAEKKSRKKLEARIASLELQNERLQNDVAKHQDHIDTEHLRLDDHQQQRSAQGPTTLVEPGTGGCKCLIS